jgi:hypothetical protein
MCEQKMDELIFAESEVSMFDRILFFSKIAFQQIFPDDYHVFAKHMFMETHSIVPEFILKHMFAIRSEQCKISGYVEVSGPNTFVFENTSLAEKFIADFIFNGFIFDEMKCTKILMHEESRFHIIDKILFGKNRGIISYLNSNFEGFEWGNCSKTTNSRFTLFAKSLFRFLFDNEQLFKPENRFIWKNNRNEIARFPELFCDKQLKHLNQFIFDIFEMNFERL